MIRYPGSKDKIAHLIMRRFPVEVLEPLWISRGDQLEYREPFFGSGAFGFRVLRNLPNGTPVWLNDLDKGIATLWWVVWKQPLELCDLVDDFEPHIDHFYRFKKEDGQDIDPVEMAFRKLALHQLSVSGFGFMSGGPLGGKQQRSEYNVACRWNPHTLCRKINERSRVLRRLKPKITSSDFADVVNGAPPHAFVYVDPPYYHAGKQLYKHGMGDDGEHERLARSLRDCRARWVLSYDDHPRVRELYSWATIEEIEHMYTNAVTKEARRKNKELVIAPTAVANTEAA